MDVVASLDTASIAALWADLPVWAKLLLWLAGAGLTVAGVFAAAAGAPLWATGLGALLAGYAFTDLFFDVDAFLTDWASYEASGNPHQGIDVIEDGINLISPVDPVAEQLTGTQMPGSQSSDGLVDQAMDRAQQRQDRMKDLIKELDQ